ncbi:MAG: protein translocase subunit SecDF [Bernardetiaceae bacterium]
MKYKGLVVFLTVFIAGLCLYYLSFTLVSQGIERDAQTAATDASGILDQAKKRAYIDSLWERTVYDIFGLASYTLKEVKEKELNLGLDLQGGMHVTLEVSPEEILMGLSGNSKDPDFLKALEQARAEQITSQSSYVDLFFAAYEQIVGVDKLGAIFVNSANSENIDFNSSDKEIKDYIRKEVDRSIDRAFEIIRTRVDKFGVSQPNVQRIPGTGRIQVELPGVDRVERVRKLLQGVAKLEFWEVWDEKETIERIARINEYWAERRKREKKSSEKPTEQTADSTATEDESLFVDQTKPDSLVAGDSTALAKAAQDSIEQLQAQVTEIFSRRVPFSQEDLRLIYMVKDTATINRLIFDPAANRVAGRDVAFYWDVKPLYEDPQTGSSFVQLHAVKTKRGGKAALEGDVIVDAKQDFGQQGIVVEMRMNAKGARKWSELTAANIKEQVAIVLDGYVYSAPVVQSQIPNGISTISGNFTIEEAQDLANILKAGKLPAPTRIVEEAVIGPSLGLAAQNQGLTSIGVGLGLVVLFMIAYYAKAGLVANVALLVNIFFIFGLLANLQAALTLPGIAGIVLTIGMSIDANVLIFERIREEINLNKHRLTAIEDGYNRAFITIVDANITTFVTAFFLFVLGSGPIKGFAVTLMVGIGCSFFTAVYITRLIVDWMTRDGKEASMSFSMPFSETLFQKLNINFLGKRRIAYLVSGSIIAVGLVLMFTTGLKYGVDFRGGRSYVMKFENTVAPSEVLSTLNAAIADASFEVKTFDREDQMKITTTYLVLDESTEADQKVLEMVSDALKSYGEVTLQSSSKVGATIADDIKSAAQTAGIFSLAALFLYILIRFREWQFSVGAVAALVHDSLVVLSCFAIASALGVSFEVDQVFVAAMLTIIGYSINDTVVIFDRIREFLGQNPNCNREETFNEAINSTLSRTLITSVTTLLVVLILFIFGGEVLRGFSFALLIGILVGTYSSIFVATPVVLDTSKKKDLNIRPTTKPEGEAAV